MSEGEPQEPTAPQRVPNGRSRKQNRMIDRRVKKKLRRLAWNLHREGKCMDEVQETLNKQFPTIGGQVRDSVLGLR